MNEHERARHLDEEVLAAYAEGGLTPSEREAAEAHLADCAECRNEAAALLEAPAASVFSGDLSDRILARLGARRPEAPMSRILVLSMRVAAAVLVVAGLSWVAGFGRAPADQGFGGLPPAELAPAGAAVVPPRPPDLGASDRYLAHLSTDKPVYRPGERVYARAVILDAFTRKPRDPATTTVFQVRSGRGEVVFQGGGASQDGVTAFGWEIPEGQTGGQFTLTATFPAEGFPDAEATFDVRDYRVPRIATDIQFLRKAYGPGDSVSATLEATRAEGGAPAGASVTAVALVDGKEAARKETTLDAQGRCLVTFDLPKEIGDGDGTLALTVRDGGVQETAAKTIPIVLRRVAVAVYPEGGDLVAGVPCRVYFEARTPKQAPADVAGRVLDGAGREVARFESAHEGRGRFEFRPRAGTAYRMAIDRPAGIAEAIPLPAVAERGFALSALREGFGADEPVRVSVASPVSTTATVGLYVVERELALSAVRLEAGKPVSVALDAKDAAGALRVTVFDAAGKPRAERLVLRRPAEALRVELSAEPDSTVPAGHVRVNVLTRDVHGRPVAAVVGLAATDDQVLTIPEPRERAPRLPTQALLGAEVAELKDAAVYLADGPEAAQRADLLLATQAWRRFAFVDLAAFLKKNEALARRALALRPPLEPATEATFALLYGANFAAFALRAGAPEDGIEEARAALGRDEDKDGAKGDRLGGLRPLVRHFHPVPAPPGSAANPTILVGQGRGAEAHKRPLDDLNKDVGARARMKWRGFAAEKPAGLLEPQGPPPPAWARVYAHLAPAARPEGERTDFTETVFWHAGLATGADGRASFEFDASDAVTTLRLRADAFSKDGALGLADAGVEVRRAFYVEPKFPLEVTAGDRIELPLSLVNGTAKAVTATVETEVGAGLRLQPLGNASLDVAARGSARQFLVLDVEPHQGPVKVRVKATAGAPSDDVTRTIKVVPAGFPVERNFGGVLERIVDHEFTVPADVVAGSLTTESAVYPTPLSSLTEALAALLREPCGCFEQTSSSNYPNVMALQYLKSHTGVDPALAQRAADLLAKGYQRLVAFECKSKGYEWFGGDPGHEALSAYGVMEFTDMAAVMDVDAAMIARTRAWLLSRRDGKGGFERNARALDSFGGAPKDVTDAYVLWALAEAGEKGLEAEVAHLQAVAQATDDPYLLALAANVIWKAGDRAVATSILERLAKKQGEKGVLAGAATSITRSGGESLDVETTSLAILAWLRSPEHVKNVERAMTWLASACKAGRFGSTQGTILALKAIVAYDAAHARPKSAGTVTVWLDGASLATVAFPADQQGPILLPDVGAKVGPGKHALRLTMEGGADMPYAFTVRCHARTPDSSAASKVEVATSLGKAEVAEGDPVDVSVTVKNRTAEGVPMVVAIVGLPGGLEARAEALKELVKAGKVDAYETRGREVILYWRGMAPRASATLTLSCLAAVPGRYTGPASRAYLYYTDEHKVWAPGLAVRISRR